MNKRGGVCHPMGLEREHYDLLLAIAYAGATTAAHLRQSLHSKAEKCCLHRQHMEVGIPQGMSKSSYCVTSCLLKHFNLSVLNAASFPMISQFPVHLIKDS